MLGRGGKASWLYMWWGCGRCLGGSVGALQRAEVRCCPLGTAVHRVQPPQHSQMEVLPLLAAGVLWVAVHRTSPVAVFLP